MNESAQNTKDTATDKYNEASDYTIDVAHRMKDTAADKDNKATNYTQDATKRTKTSATNTYKDGEDK